MALNDNFLKAARGERVETIPVWFMRQAGRSLPGYRKLRETYGVLELTNTPELAAQVSIEPVERIGVDAAVLFADIMLLPIAMGMHVEIVDSIGPVIEDSINTPGDLKKLQPFAPEKIEFLQQTIRILRNELSVPVIGFSGAPFTLASYLVEGKPTRNWYKTKRFMLEHPEAWNSLMTTLSDATIEYLRAQVIAGAQAVQIFDSWVGCLSAAQYRTQVLPHMQHILSSIQELNVPRIHFGTDTGSMLADFSNVDAEVIGLDWRMDIARAKEIVGTKAMQGNLDPAIMLADWPTIQRAADEILNSINSHTGYIFNFGHGVLPETDDQKLKQLVEYVHSK